MPRSTSQKDSYSIKIPKVSLKNNSYTPVLMIVLLVATFFLGRLSAQVQYLQKGSTVTAPTTGAQVAPVAPGQVAPGTKVNVSDGHLPALGNKNAKVTVIEFSDFQCPFCESYFNDAEKGIIKDYVDTGKVKFIYRQLPLAQLHPNAYKAASASECANEQGKFWEMHDLLFKNQSAWSSLDNVGAIAKFKEYSGTLGLDTGSFSSCLDSDKYKSDIDKDMADASAAGANGTPATFVNGMFLSGAQPYSAFKILIDQELAKAK